MQLGVTNRIIDDSDFMPVNFDRWFGSNLKSNDGFESTIPILIESRSKIDLFRLKDQSRDWNSQLNDLKSWFKDQNSWLNDRKSQF